MTTETPYTLRDLATMVADQYPGLDWYHGAPEPGEETAAEWAASCTQPESRCDDLHVVWSDGGGKVIVQAIVGDTQNAAIRAVYFAQLAPADVLRLLDELDAANAKLAATRALAAMWDENAAACDKEAASQVGVNRMGLEIEALYDRRHARLIRDAVGEDQ